MSKTKSSLVENAYGAYFQENAERIPLSALVSFGLRRNPKRAHLLVSDVLGKHVPQSPHVMEFAGRLLGALVNEFTSETTDEHREAVSKAYEAFQRHLAANDGSLDDFSIPELPPVIKTEGINDGTVVVGFAETATGLGFEVAGYLDEWYIHTTRNFEGHDKWIGFEEEHSHATSHALIPENVHLLSDPSKVLVLVDDEFSTGLTIKNIIREMHELAPRKRYVIASLVDGRNANHVAEMEEFAREIGAEIFSVALAVGEVKLPENFVENVFEDIQNEVNPLRSFGEGDIADANVTHINVEDCVMGNTQSKVGGYPDAYLPSLDAATALKILPVLKDGNILLLGQEEFMYFPQQVGLCLEIAQDESVRTSTTTRSPIHVKVEAGYPIQSGITFTNNQGEQRYAYNIDNYKNIVLILEPGQDVAELAHANGLIHALTSITPNLIIVHTN